MVKVPEGDKPTKQFTKVMMIILNIFNVISLPAVDPHVHVGQVHEGDDARGEEAGPVDVVVHVVWINS